MSVNKYNSTSGQLERIDSIIATDATPTSGSINPVQSGGVYTALAGKQNILTFDATPTSASSNPVTSGGIYTALGTKANESMIGDAWTASTTYGVAGNTNGYPVYCINNNVLYKCIQEHTGAAYEPPNASYWEATDVNTEISALNNSLTEIMKKAVFIAYNTGTINPELGSVKGISGYNSYSLVFHDNYISGVNSKVGWNGNYFENPVDLTYFDTLYIKFENVSAITSSTGASYQLMLWNSTPVWNGGYGGNIFMDREGDTYARNYAQGTYVVEFDLSNYTVAQKENTYIGIGFCGNTNNSHILQIWAK